MLTFYPFFFSACGSLLCNTFGGNIKFAKRPINIICKSGGMDIIEEVGISNRKQVRAYRDILEHFSLIEFNLNRWSCTIH